MHKFHGSVLRVVWLGKRSLLQNISRLRRVGGHVLAFWSDEALSEPLLSKFWQLQFNHPEPCNEEICSAYLSRKMANMRTRWTSCLPSICQYAPRRAYSAVPRISLAFDLHSPAQPSSNAPGPIIFMHGLFGSKKNNRSISKWACHNHTNLGIPLIRYHRALARDLGRPIYAVVSISAAELYLLADRNRIFETTEILLIILNTTMLRWQKMWLAL